MRSGVRIQNHKSEKRTTAVVNGVRPRETDTKRTATSFSMYSLCLCSKTRLTFYRRPSATPFFLKKDWLEAFRVHLAKKHPRLDVKPAPHTASMSVAPCSSRPPMQERGVELSEAQHRRIAELAASTSSISPSSSKCAP